VSSRRVPSRGHRHLERKEGASGSEEDTLLRGEVADELMRTGYTYAQVAEELGYSSRGTAFNAVAKALREQTAEAVTDLRELENSRLDALQLALWDAAMTGPCASIRPVRTPIWGAHVRPAFGSGGWTASAVSRKPRRACRE